MILTAGSALVLHLYVHVHVDARSMSHSADQGGERAPTTTEEKDQKAAVKDQKDVQVSNNYRISSRYSCVVVFLPSSCCSGASIVFF